MTDKMVVEIDSKDAEIAVQNLERLSTAAVQMGKAFENSRGATSALKELRMLLVGIKGKGSALDELTSSIANLNSTTDSLKKSFAGSIGHLGKILKSEMAELKTIVQESGMSVGRAATEGLDKGMEGAVGVIKRQGKTIAAAAKAEATRIYEAMVAGQANAKVKDVGALFKLDEAGATLSPYHKQVLDNWKKSSAETFKALKAQLANDRADLEAQVKAENNALQAALQRMESESKARDSSLAGIYKGSLARGTSAISQVRSSLKAEREALVSTVRDENAALQASLKRLEDESRTRQVSLAGIYRDSLGRGNFAIAQVKTELKAEAARVIATVRDEESQLQKALQAMEQSDKMRAASLSNIYADSLKRGTQGIARVKAELRAQADAIIQANDTELKRVRAQVAAASNDPQGLYQKFNAQSGIAGPVVDPAKIGQVKQLSSAFKQLTIDGNDAHSMARGLASGFNLLWLTWGNLAPLFAGASISFGLKKTFDIGSEVEYQIKMMETLGQATQAQGRIIRQALRDIDQTTQFSLVELSQAMVRLGQAGKTPAEALEILRPAADLASVGMVDLKTSTDLLIQTQALFGKSTADVGKIAAQVFEITKSGVLNVEDIGASMKYASEANTRFGKSVEETLTILGALAQAGIKGSSAGTAYINFLRDLNGRSGPAISAMKALEKATGSTIEVFKKTGEQRSAVDIFTDIAAAADKLKAKDADKLLAKIFSDRGGRAFFAMVRDGTIDLNKMVERLEKVDPQSLFLAAKGMMDTTRGALNVLQGAMVGALDKVFEANETKFKTFITDITAVVSSPEFALGVHGMVNAVGGLYNAIKTLLPVIEVLGTAWVVFKAASIGVSIFQGLAVAIAGMAPVLGMTGTAIMRNTAALVVSTEAWSANGVAMIGNVAASRAAAAGMDAVGTAAARSAAVASVAGVGMRGLSVVLGFLANPIVGIIATLGLLGAAFWSAKSDAEGATSGIAAAVTSNGRINIGQWNEEIKKLRERNSLMGKSDVYTPMEAGINEARTKLAKESAEYMTILEKYENESKGASARQQEVLDARYSRVLDSKMQSIKKEQEAINQARSAIDSARMKDLTEREESERQQRAKQDRLNKPQGSLDIPSGGGGFGGRAAFVEQIRIANDNELKEIEKRNNAELSMMQTLSANAQKILDARHQAGLISEGEYQAQAFAQVQQSEADQLAMLNRSKDAYGQALVARATELGQALQKATELKDATQIDKFTQDLQNLGETAKTFYEGVDSSIAKIADNGMARLEVASIKAQGAIKKLADTEREYWKKDKDEINKLRSLDAMEKQYKNINESVFSLDVANKAAAMTGAAEAEKFNAKLAEMDYAYNVAEQSALAFMSANIMALASGDTEAQSLYQNLRNVADALKDARNAASVQAEASIRDRSLIAFEKAREAQIAAFSNGLASAVETSIFEGGKAGGQKFVEVLRNELLRKPLQVILQGIMGSIVNSIMGGVVSGAASSMGGSLLGSAATSLFGGGGSLLAGAGTAAGYGASALFAGNGMGALAGGWSMLTGGGTMAAMTQGFGMIAGVLGPIALGIGALVSLIGSTSGETRTGGQFGVAFDGEVTNYRRGQTYTYEGQQYDRDFSGGARNPLVNGQAYRLEGDPVGNESSIRKAVAGTAKTINDLLYKYGSKATLTAYSAGLETSGKGRGGVFAGGRLSTGAVFGESGEGDNYAGTLYEKFSTNSPDFEQALKDFTLDLQQSTLQALQAATDLPEYVSRVLEGVDIEALGAEEVAELLTLVAELPNRLLESFGISRDNLVAVFAEGLATGDAAKAGETIANTVVTSIETTMLNNAAGQIFDIVNAGIIAPLLDAMITGASVSELLSSGMIQATIERAKKQAEIMVAVFNDPAFKEAMQAIRETLRETFTEVGSAFDYTAEFGAYSNAGNSVSDTLNRQIQILRLLGKEEEALALERAEILKGLNDENRTLQLQIWQLEDAKRAQEEYNAALNSAQQAFDAAQTAVESAQDAVKSIQAEGTDNYLTALERVKNAQENIANIQLEAAREIYQTYTDLAKSLRDFIKGETVAKDETTAALMFQRTLTLAMSGDQEAMKDLTNAAKTSMEAARLASASSGDYELSRAKLMASLDAAARKAEELAGQEPAAEDPMVKAVNELQEAQGALAVALQVANAINAPLVKTQESLITRYQEALAKLGEAQAGLMSALDALNAIKNSATNIDGSTDDTAANTAAMLLRMAELKADIVTELGINFGNLDTSLDGLLDFDEFRLGLEGMATDEELRKIFDELDTNGDGILSLLESLNITTMEAADRVGDYLTENFATLDTNISGLLDFDEFRLGLEGLATDDELKKIFEELDTNGDGVISQLEALNLNTDQLQTMVVNELRENFDKLDTTVDGLLSFDEFKTGFPMTATDAELRKIFTELDTNGDGVISRLELLNNRVASLLNATLAYSTGATMRVSFDANDPLRSVFNNISRTNELMIDSMQMTLTYLLGTFINENMTTGPQDSLFLGTYTLQSQSMFALWDIREAINRVVTGAASFKVRSEYSGSGNTYASGGAFTNGIVKSPTFFNESVMGEVTPEAIMPLSRMSDGSLGVHVTSNDSGEDSDVNLVAEIRGLRADNRAQAKAIVALQQRLTKVVERWDNAGMPEERPQS